MENYKIAMGERMKEQRKLLNLTQEQLAEKLNISVKHYGGVERGTAGLSLDTLIELSEIFQISLDYLIKGTKNTDDIIPHRLREIYLSTPADKREVIPELLELINKL